MKTLTYGVLPTQEQFDAAFERVCYAGPFWVGNDSRMVTCALTASDLWRELVKTHAEWKEDYHNMTPAMWCSNVLYSLGFEWV